MCYDIEEDSVRTKQGLLWRKVSENGGLEKLVLHAFATFSAICIV